MVAEMRLEHSEAPGFGAASCIVPAAALAAFLFAIFLAAMRRSPTNNGPCLEA